MVTPLDLEAGVRGQIWHLQKIHRPRFPLSFFLILNAKDQWSKEILGLFDDPLFGMNDMIWQPFCFQNKVTITLRQAFPSFYILCKLDEASFNI